MNIAIPVQLNDLIRDVSITSPAQGDVLCRGAAKWNNLPAPTDSVLRYLSHSGVPNTNPSWQTVAVPTFNSLSPMTTLGDTIYGAAVGSGTRLPGNTTAAKQFYTQTGTGSVSAAPAWGAIVNADIPSALTGKTYEGLTFGGSTGTGTTVVFSAAPALTGIPTAPTAAALTNTTQLATTAFVTGAVSTATAGAALTKTDDTNVTLTLGGTPSTALLQAASITVGWAGTLGTSRGGTGVDNSTGGTANTFWARPNGAAGAATYRAIVAADIPTLNQNTTGSAAKWTTARNLAGNSVDGSANVAFANQFVVQGTADSGLSAAQFLGALGTGIVKNTTTTGVLSIAAAGDFPTLNQNTTGNAATATALQTARTINGVAFDGTANVTVTAAAGTLTGTTLNATVVASSLTSVGTLSGLTEIVSDAATNATSTGATYGHDTSGTPAAGYGTVYKYQLQDSTTADTDAFNQTVTWATAAHATRKARAVLNVYDTAAREALRLEASGAAAMIGFLGASASAALASPDLGTLATTFGLASGTPTFAGVNVTGTVPLATALNIARAIYGNAFDGTAALTQIIASTYGGTGNGFTKFSGPTTAEKTFTLPNASATVLTDNAVVTVAQGGTGLGTLIAHAVYVGNGTAAPTALSVGATNTVLRGSTGADPAFGALVAADLPGTAVTAGSYSLTSLTVDPQGRLTAASTGYTTSGTGTVLMATASPTTTGTLIGAAATFSGTVTANGTVVSALTAGTGTQSPSVTITGPAHTALTASTEAIDVNFNLARTVQFATGALTTQRAMVVQAPTYGFVGASTLTTAVTLDITGPPVAGTNATITNQIATRISAGVAAGVALQVAGVSSQSGDIFQAVISTGQKISTFDSSGQYKMYNSSGTFLGKLTNNISSGFIALQGTAAGNGFTFSGGTLPQIVINSSFSVSTASATYFTIDGLGTNPTVLITGQFAAAKVLVARAAASVSANIFEAQNSSSTILHALDKNGSVRLTPPAVSATPGVTGQGWFDSAAATFTDNNTAGSGTATSMAFHTFAQPTLAATNASVVTTDAATVYIANGPANGTNNTITNKWGLWNGGNLRSDGSILNIRSVPYTWPAANASGVLTNNGSGTLSWAAASGTPAGSDTQLQYNNSGAFGATGTEYAASGLLSGATASGSNVAGTDFYLAGGRPTGNAAAGQLCRKYPLVNPTSASTVRAFSANPYPIPGTMFTVSSSATAGNSTSELTLIGTVVGTQTVEGGIWRVGRTLRLKMRGTIDTSAVLAPGTTYRIKVKIGSTVILDSAASTFSVTTGVQGFGLEADITCRTLGASGTVFAQGEFWYDTTLGTIKDDIIVNTAATTLDTTADGTLDVTNQWSVADANLTMTSTNVCAEWLN